MEDQEIVQAEQTLIDVKKIQNQVSNYDPSVEVEHSIVSLLRHRIEKLQEDAQFEQSIKDAILARLPEAEFRELISILNIVQDNANISTEKLLLPFIPKAGERIPLLDEKKDSKTENGINETSRSEDLQAVAELGRAIRLLKEKQQKKLEQEKSSE
jgi:glycyl-tRNA synthetase beta subunit